MKKLIKRVLKKLIKRVRFKLLKITELTEKKKTKNKREILGKKRKLELFENGKYYSGGTGTVNRIKI